MDPTPDEQEGFNTINDVANWAALPEDGGTFESPRGSLFRALGVNGTEHPRTLAAISEATYDAVIAAWRIGWHAPTPAQLAQAGLLARGCRVKCRSQQIPAGGGDPTCWIEGFSHALCCSSEHGPRGNVACWDANFNFERCCTAAPSPESPLRAPSPGSSPRGVSQGGMQGLLAANMKGPNGEELSLVPTEYVLGAVVLFFSFWALSRCLTFLRSSMASPICCRRRRQALSGGKVSLQCQRQRRLEHFSEASFEQPKPQPVLAAKSSRIRMR